MIMVNLKNYGIGSNLYLIHWIRNYKDINNKLVGLITFAFTI